MERRIVFLSNYFNHHQKPFSDEMYRIIGDRYRFVETSEIPEFRLKFGYREISAPYVIKYNDETCNEINKLIMEADAVIYGEAPLRLVKKRYESGRLTFRAGESRYKSISRYLKWPVYTYQSMWINRGYLLCASAYAPFDYMLSGMHPKKCFRWGYFTDYRQFDIDVLIENKRIKNSQRISILWAGRLIPYKHPEAVICVADRLKQKGLQFDIRVIGSGELEKKIRQKVMEKDLGDVISFLGSMTPDEVRNHMEEADIFLFTSDRQEGWGAVLNESMNSGCVVIADSNIGSVPYMINDGVNGFIYKGSNMNELCNKVESLVQHPEKIMEIGKKAYLTVAENWNGKTAAERLLLLCESLIKENSIPIESDVCSPSPLLIRRW